jgi:hypothetical protein
MQECVVASPGKLVQKIDAVIAPKPMTCEMKRKSQEYKYNLNKEEVKCLTQTTRE